MNPIAEWRHRRALERALAAERREEISHAQMLKHLGYAPDDARIRIRRAQAPPIPSPKQT